MFLLCVLMPSLFAADGPRHIPISVEPDDLLPTGNEWLSLPTIHADNASLDSFNVLSMRSRGLLEVTGARGRAAIEPYFMVDGARLQIHNPTWEVIEYWGSRRAYDR